MCQFSAVSKFEKKTIASLLFLCIEFHWLPFFQHEDCGFDVCPRSNFLPVLHCLHENFFPISAGWAKKCKPLNKGKSKTFFTGQGWEREFQCNPLLLSTLNNKKLNLSSKRFTKIILFYFFKPAVVCFTFGSLEMYQFLVLTHLFLA